ncbi:hypothetical protein PVAND_001050 [Polypedilum vanderplanki]|uniref:Uncharacterized protein n=1 Tax=Polypedilum vanderplanki TaxID=319348 RepID=A0A9J6BLS7_POLVA|nr:hypothetical protein PVAND_001050 [Polypedilum vanderplanki]
MDHHLTLLKLRRTGITYYERTREALNVIFTSLRANDLSFAKFLISNFVFDIKPKISDTHEVMLIGVLLTEYFFWDDAIYRTLLITLIDNSNGNKKSFLIKFIMTSFAINNIPALNIVGFLLLDPFKGKMLRTINNMGEELIQEITCFSLNFTKSFRILTTLPQYSAVMTNTIYLITTENFKNQQLLPSNLRDLFAIWMSYASKSQLFFTLIHDAQYGLGTFLLCSFCKYIILNEFTEKSPSYSTMHLKIIECLTSEEVRVNAKPTIDAYYFLDLITTIQAEIGKKNHQDIENAIDKLAQHVQVTKPFFLGNTTLLYATLKQLPQTALLKLVLII